MTTYVEFLNGEIFTDPTSTNDRIIALGDNQVMTSGAGNDVLMAMGDNTTLNANGGLVSFMAGEVTGNDTLVALGNHDTLYSGVVLNGHITEIGNPNPGTSTTFAVDANNIGLGIMAGGTATHTCEFVNFHAGDFIGFYNFGPVPAGTALTFDQFTGGLASFGIKAVESVVGNNTEVKYEYNGFQIGEHIYVGIQDPMILQHLAADHALLALGSHA